jgi:S1-C subfamily serine protease
MNLEESFNAVSPCVIGFVSKLERTRIGERPIFSTIIATGFFVDPSGIAVTTRHVIEAADQIPTHPTTGEFPIAAFVFLQGDAEECAVPSAGDQKMVRIAVLWVDRRLVRSDRSGHWIVQLGVREVPFLALATHDFYLKVGMESLPWATRWAHSLLL